MPALMKQLWEKRLTSDTSQNIAVKKPFYDRVRFQIAIFLIVHLIGIYFPLLFSLPLTDLSWATSGSQLAKSTLIYTTLAALADFMLIRQLTNFPGIKAFSYILPCTMLTYGFLVFAMFVLRMEYSRYIIFASFMTVLVWLHFDFYLRRHGFIPKIAVIPQGNTRGITGIEHVKWITLEKPETRMHNIDGIVVDFHSALGEAWERYIAKCVLEGLPVYDVKSFKEALLGRVEIRELSENQFGSLLPSNLYLKAKRSLDVVLAVVLMPVFLFVMLLAAICIKLESREPVFFTQQRMGFRAIPFTIYKLRTMSSETTGGSKFTKIDDDRITRMGKFLRKYRIDEFPQIFNILKGEMSWIGPRPESIELSEWYSKEIPFYIYRHAVRPGLSGWAQVKQGNVAEVEAASIKLQHDFYYIKNYSPWLDILIIFKTIKTMVTGFGSI